MSGKIKALTLLVLGMLALAGGEYLAGFLTLWILGMDQVPLEAATYWQYFRALHLPQVAPYVLKIKLCGAFGFGVPLVAWLGLLIPVLRSKPESMHGEARFARLADLKKAGLLKQTPQSILMGKFKGRYLWLGGAQHVITISPTRSGKTTSIAIPALLSYQHSMVVLDLKGELHKETSGWREAQHHKVYVWAPYDDAGNTHRFNPMTTLAGLAPAKRIGEIQTIAAILYPDEPGKDPFWTSQSRAAFTAVTSYLFEAWDDGRMSYAAGNVDASTACINTSPDFPRSVLPGTNNMFNVKAFGGWTGESKTFRVHETYGNDGEKTWEHHPFRVYKKVEDSFRDRANFLRENPRYAKAGLFDEGTLGDLEGEARALQRAGFATDKSYAKYLADVFNGRTMRRGIALATGQEMSPEAASAGLSNGVLREGNRSAAVGELQSRLHRLGYDGPDGTPLAADQDFGRRTRLALEAFQREHMLKADGIAGPATLAAVEHAVQTELRSIGQPDAAYLQNKESGEALSAYQTVVPTPTYTTPVLPVVATAQTELKVDALQAAAMVRPDTEATRLLQENLNTLGVTDLRGEALAVDGLYGPSTQTAVARFQAGHELPITGHADEATRSMVQGQAFIADLQRASPAMSWGAPVLDTVHPSGPERVVPSEASVAAPASSQAALALNDPRHPDSPTHELYNELQRCIPDASENRLLQFTSVCHTNMITADNLTAVYLDEEKMTLDFRGSGPLTTPAQIDLSLPPPRPEQAVEQIQKFDQQEMQMAQTFQAQSAQLGQQGMSM